MAVVKLIVFLAVAVGIVKLLVLFKDRIRFFATGSDKGFKFSEIGVLWKLAILEDLEEPEQLYYSLPLVSKAITDFIAQSREEGTEGTQKNQELLSKLYDYRTRISLEHENNRGIDTTKYLDKGQKLRIILPGRGVFFSEILDNSTDIVIRTPTQKGLIVVAGPDWIGRQISVYLWRKGDASYVFDTTVTSSEIFMGVTAVRIKHSNQLLRTQKRQSIRAKCEIEAQLYFIQDLAGIDYNAIETSNGFRCMLEDISQNGAMIRVGGKGVKDARLKIQFNIGDSLVVMFGVIRDVEYNKTYNQSRLHFECLHIDDAMRNLVLSFVYKTLPEEKREVVEAMAQTEEDAQIDAAESGFSREDSGGQGGVMTDLRDDNSAGNEQPAAEDGAQADPELGGFAQHYEDKMEEFRSRMTAFNHGGGSYNPIPRK